jgi:hypothetical protein
MSSWSPDELERIGRATELRLASKRPDGSVRPYITIWVVRAGDDVFVRSAYGPNSGWYRRAAVSRQGRIRSGGVERDVTFEEAWPQTTDAVTAAYHAKYGRYGPAIVGTVVSPEAEQLTLRIVPD